MASNPAPGELELVRAFVNTWDEDDGIEDFHSPAALAQWLVERDLAQPPVEADDRALARAVELREALRALLRHNAGEELEPAALAILDQAAQRAQLTPRFGVDGPTRPPRLEPAKDGVDAALGRILGRVAAAMADGTWPRLKVCLADTCQWAFYDLSRNRSAVWCDMRVCGNRHKVRSFRERRESEHRHS